MPMTRSLLTALMCICLNAAAADVVARTGPAPEAVKKALKNARKSADARGLLRIGIEGQLAPGLSRLEIYGRGVGIWNDERQFELEDKAVKQAIDYLINADFAAMPDRFTHGSSNDRAETGAVDPGDHRRRRRSLEDRHPGQQGTDLGALRKAHRPAGGPVPRAVPNRDSAPRASKTDSARSRTGR